MSVSGQMQEETRLCHLLCVCQSELWDLQD